MIIESVIENPFGEDVLITYYDEHTMECLEHGEIFLAHPTGRHCPHCGKSLQMAIKTAKYPKGLIFVDVNCERKEA